MGAGRVGLCWTGARGQWGQRSMSIQAFRNFSGIFLGGKSSFMKTNLSVVVLLGLLVLLAAVAVWKDNGRYQLMSSAGDLFKVNTETGQVWAEYRMHGRSGWMPLSAYEFPAKAEPGG